MADGTKQTKIQGCVRTVTGVIPDMAGVITGIPCAIAALMLARHEVSVSGVHAPETAIQSDRMIEELRNRGFEFSVELV